MLTRLMVALVVLFVIFVVTMAAGDFAGLWDTAAIFERIDAFLTNPAGL